MGTLRARLTSGLLWNLLAALSTQGSTCLTSIVLSNMAGIATFGRYAMILNTLAVITGLSSLSMSYTTTKYISEFRSVDRDQTARMLSLCSRIAFTAGTLAAMSLLFGATPLASYLLKESALATSVRIGAAFVLFSTINSYQLGALAGLEAYRPLGVAAILSGLITITISTAGFVCLGLTGAVMGQSIGAGCRYLIHRGFLARECHDAGILRKRGSLTGQSRILSGFALPAALSGYLSLPALWFANAFLFRQTDGANQLAIYTAALTLKTALLFLPNTITGVSLSVINNAKATIELRQYLTLYRYNIGIVCGIVMVCTIPFILFGQILLRAFGREFSAGREVLLLLALSTIADGITIAAYPLIQSQGKMWLSFWALAVPRDVIFTVLAYRWIPIRGSLGLAQAQLTVSIVVAAATIVVCLHIVRSLLRLSPVDVSPSRDEACANV